MDTWVTLLITAISSGLGAGGVVKLYQLYREGRTSDVTYVLDQYRELMEIEKAARKKDTGRFTKLIEELESSISNLENGRLMMTAEIIRLKGELAQCKLKS